MSEKQSIYDEILEYYNWNVFNELVQVYRDNGDRVNTLVSLESNHSEE
jgi:hypothetical protein